MSTGTTTPLRQHHLPNGLFVKAPASSNGFGSMRRAVSMSREGNGSGLGAIPNSAASNAADEEEDPIHVAMRARFAQADAAITGLFGHDGELPRGRKRKADQMETDGVTAQKGNKIEEPPKKKAARIIEDDYGDDEDEDEEEDVDEESPLKSKSKAIQVNGVSPLAVRSPAPFVKPGTTRTNTTSSDQQIPKSSEDVRKQHEEDKKAAAEQAKRSFQQMFYTLEYDRDAMLEQQKLDELDREVENEISGEPGASGQQQDSTASASTAPQQGSLGSADLGASSLTLKHLIARIDAKRDLVRASDSQLRTLISEVKKGRSKWASEDRVGQEELYESAEKVLMELKAMTESAQPFLQRVSKREAPDYFNVIKSPMDIGTMIKKLKQLAYKSKKDFVEDLYLIWANALKYNSDARHPVRKKALTMQKECDKLVRLIPDIVVRDRAEVEAEERRLASMENGTGPADDSDEDDVPIKASRGRKAPKKGNKSGPSTARKAPPSTTVTAEDSSTPQPPERKDSRPPLHSSASNLKVEFMRAESEAVDSSMVGLSPGGAATPVVNGIHSAPPGSQADLLEMYPQGSSAAIQEDVDEEDTEFKTWKQVTMKDRAYATALRHRLFQGMELNVEEPALLRSKAGMRRWLRQQKLLAEVKPSEQAEGGTKDDEGEEAATGDTLAEGIEQEEDSTLPDYYNPLSAIPDIADRWRWTTDSEGYVVPQSEQFLRIFDKTQYHTSPGHLNEKIAANMRQMQETRKICAKIGIVKQMQVQAQTYQNQFQKYEPKPFVEQDVGNVVVSEDGPLIAPWVNRAALQRSVGKVFYHAGFEDFQPSALEAITDVAGEFLRRLTETFKCYNETPKQASGSAKFSMEEQILHTLGENGIDLEALESYVKDDVERLSTKLGVVHERMKAHLADLLRPALDPNAGADGAGAFQDGSEQFVGGDFAEDLDEDFFGFKELGLADELGLETLSVPLHLLQNRMHSVYQSQNQGPVSTSGLTFEQPPPYDALGVESLPNIIGVARDFFKNKLRANRDEPLLEDEDLPAKQRFPKPRLPPTGKISSPRKRPLREQQQMAKKKRKLEESGRAEDAKQPPLKTLKFAQPQKMENDSCDPEKEDRPEGAMISPESIAAN